MDFIKKNLAFTILLVLFVATFFIGGYLTFAESSKIAKAKQSISSAEAQLNSYRFAEPAPTDDNVTASTQNVEQLLAVLQKIRRDLGSGVSIRTSDDGIRVMSAIQQFISEYHRKAAAHTDPEADPSSPPSKIAVKDDFAFGFERYLDESTILEDPAKIPVLDKQRQILSYLLDKLIASSPQSISIVKREELEALANRGADVFKVNEAISAEVPGAIETLGFSITFSGYTDSLRKFLNELAKFELPIVVRSIEVKRPPATQATSSASAGVDDLFAAFGGDDIDEAPAEVKPKPVFENIVSTFTVVLEFYEIVLPDETTDDNA